MEFIKSMAAEVLPYLLLLLCALLAAAAAVWAGAMEYAAQCINQAATNPALTDGPARMTWVVSQVRAYLPGAIRGILTDRRVQAAVQRLYNSMKSFVFNYLEWDAEMITPELAKTTETANDAGAGGAEVESREHL